MQKSDTTEHLQIQFVQFGLQYYASGRFAVLNLHPPVSGNLMHHAVEMILKGILAQKLSRDELLKLGHNLIRLWGAAKAIDNYQELTQFDDAIAKLHRFERIRYPDKLITEGATMQTGLRKGDEIIVSQPKSNPNTSYEMALEDIDHLVKVLFKLLGHNPLFYLNSFKQSARSILAEQNIHPFWQ